MKPDLLLSHLRIFSNSELYRLGVARSLLEALPDIHFGVYGLEAAEASPDALILPTCHMFVRAIGPHLGLPYEDGYYGSEPEQGFKHSWLRTEEGNLIDLTPVAVVSGPHVVPLLVRNDQQLGTAGYLYHPAEISIYGRSEPAVFERRLSILKEVVDATAAVLGISEKHSQAA